MEKKTPTRGGARRGAGRPPMTGATMGHTTITLDALTRRKLSVLGNGNISEGVRIAAEVAFDRYQATP